MRYPFFNDARLVLVILWVMILGGLYAQGDEPTGISANTPVSGDVELVKGEGPVGPEVPESVTGEGSQLADTQGKVSPQEGPEGLSETKQDKNADASVDRAMEERAVGRSAVNVSRESPKESDGKSKDGPSGWTLIVSLSLVLMLIVGLSWLYRRYMPGGKLGGHSGAIEVVARNAINPKQSLCLVKLGDRLLLVGLSPNHMASLERIDDPDEIGRIMGQVESQAAHSVSKSFQGIFHHEAREYDPEEEGLDSEDYGEARQWRDDGRELSRLLNKVKSLTKMRFRS
ncbi:MAG: flagellar biosynthetic protein FliO [Phycisphaerae bacterium]|nr:flagellar biosynthetic protein FliO [Phycisphaerae bacterium]